MITAQAGAYLSITSGALIVAWVAYDGIRDHCRIDADPVRCLIRLALHRGRP